MPSGKLHQIASGPNLGVNNAAKGIRTTIIETIRMAIGAHTAPVDRTTPFSEKVIEKNTKPHSTMVLICLAKGMAGEACGCWKEARKGSL